MPDDHESEAKYTVSAENSRGVQAGDHNVQSNVFKAHGVIDNTARQDVTAGNDATVVGRDMIFYNNYPGRPGNDSMLDMLTPGEGAKRLATLADADETLDSLLRELRSAAPEAVGSALLMLLRHDETLVIALLGRVSPVMADRIAPCARPTCSTPTSRPGTGTSRTARPWTARPRRCTST